MLRVGVSARTSTLLDDATQARKSFSSGFALARRWRLVGCLEPHTARMQPMLAGSSAWASCSSGLSGDGARQRTLFFL